MIGSIFFGKLGQRGPIAHDPAPMAGMKFIISGADDRHASALCLLLPLKQQNITSMLGILNAAEIEQLLERQIVGRIGCSIGDKIYVVPISYAYDGEYVYCHTREGMKIDFMRSNPKVCFEVDHLNNMANWKSAIAWGTFEELTDPEERMKALRKLHERILPFIASETVQLSPDWPFLPQELNKIPGITFRLRLTAKTGRFEMTDSESFFAS
jgi:uncharacterized protein